MANKRCTFDPAELQRVIEKHAATVTLDLLLDLAKALGLKLSVKVDGETIS